MKVKNLYQHGSWKALLEPCFTNCHLAISNWVKAVGYENVCSLYTFTTGSSRHANVLSVM